MRWPFNTFVMEQICARRCNWTTVEEKRATERCWSLVEDRGEVDWRGNRSASYRRTASTPTAEKFLQLPSSLSFLTTADCTVPVAGFTSRRCRYLLSLCSSIWLLLTLSQLNRRVVFSSGSAPVGILTCMHVEPCGTFWSWIQKFNSFKTPKTENYTGFHCIYNLVSHFFQISIYLWSPAHTTCFVLPSLHNSTYMLIITYDWQGGVRGLYACRVGKYGGYMKYVGCVSLCRIYGRATCIPDQQTSTSPRTMRAMSG